MAPKPGFNRPSGNMAEIQVDLEKVPDASKIDLPSEIPKQEPSTQTREGLLGVLRGFIDDPNVKIFDKLKAIGQLAEMQGYNRAVNMDQVRRWSQEELKERVIELIICLHAAGVRLRSPDA